MSSNELFYKVGSEKQDADYHDDILKNESADRLISRMAIQRAIQRGMSQADAFRLYGLNR